MLDRRDWRKFQKRACRLVITGADLICSRAGIQGVGRVGRVPQFGQLHYLWWVGAPEEKRGGSYGEFGRSIKRINFT